MNPTLNGKQIELAGRSYILLENTFAPTTIEYIKATVAARFGMTVEHMSAERRKEREVTARWYVFTLARDKGFTLTEIGDTFPRMSGQPMNHGTVLHGIRRLADLCDIDAKVKSNLAELRAQLNTTKEK